MGRGPEAQLFTVGRKGATGYMLLLLSTVRSTCYINTSYQKLPFGSGDDPTVALRVRTIQ